MHLFNTDVFSFMFLHFSFPLFIILAAQLGSFIFQVPAELHSVWFTLKSTEQAVTEFLEL